MRQGLSRWVWCSAATMAIAGGFAGGCDFKDPDPGSFLVVGFARTQPATEDQGVSVVIQEGGGAFLRLRTFGGTHQSATSPSEGVETSCMAVPVGADTKPKRATDPLFLTVTPKDAKGECRFFVELLSSGKDCTGAIVEQRMLAVSRERALQPEPATTGGGGAGGAGGKTGGAGGTGGATASGGGGTGGSTASGGAGGAGGTTGGAGGATSTGGMGTGGTGGGQ